MRATPYQLGKLSKDLYRWRGEYKYVAEKTGMKYDTIRKLAVGTLPFASKKLIAPVQEWLKTNKGK